MHHAHATAPAAPKATKPKTSLRLRKAEARESVAARYYQLLSLAISYYHLACALAGSAAASLYVIRAVTAGEGHATRDLRSVTTGYYQLPSASRIHLLTYSAPIPIHI